MLEKKYNLITLWDVIEHIYDLNDILTIISNLLDDDGFLVINIPDIDSFPASLMGKFWPMFLDVHLHYFNCNSICNLLSKHDFILVTSYNYFQCLEMGYILKRGFKHIFGINLHPYIESLLNFKISYYIGQRTYVFKKNNF